jgi:acetylornithine/succinyldiaminopimelate/putrescine aminotransferase
LGKKLAELDGVRSVRGLGLLLAAELVQGRAGDVAAQCLDRGLVLNAVTATALRMEPSLLISEAEIDEGIDILTGALEAVAQEERS